MIVLGTPSITLDFGIPDWAVLLILGSIILSYQLGKRQGKKEVYATDDEAIHRATGDET